MKIEQIVKEYRKEHNLSQRAFASLCGLSSTYIWYLEQGKNPQTGRPMQPSIPALNKFKAMAANNEKYSRVLIQEFVKAVYLYDDDGGLRLDCYYGDGIKLYSPNGETAPPQFIRSKLSAFSAAFSCRI